MEVFPPARIGRKLELKHRTGIWPISIGIVWKAWADMVHWPWEGASGFLFWLPDKLTRHSVYWVALVTISTDSNPQATTRAFHTPLKITGLVVCRQVSCGKSLGGLVSIFKSAFMEWAPSSKHKVPHRPPSLSRSAESHVLVCFEPCWSLDLSSLRPSSQTCLNRLKHKNQSPTAHASSSNSVHEILLENSLTHPSFPPQDFQSTWPEVWDPNLTFLILSYTLWRLLAPQLRLRNTVQIILV